MTLRHTLRLLDGRALSYRMAGCQPGTAHAPTVLYHCGWPSSSAEVLAWHQEAVQQGVQLVAVDRPGIGGSSFNAQGSFASYAHDISQLMQHLRLPKVIHVGTSGGGPYAAACAALQPGTTAALGLVASMTHCAGPGSSHLVAGMDWGNRVGYSCIAYAPALTSLSLAVAAPFVFAASRAVSLLVAACNSTARRSSSCPATCKEASDTAGAAGGQPLCSQQASTHARPAAGHSSAVTLLQWVAAGLGKAALWAAGLTLPAPDREALVRQPGMVMQVLPTALSEAFEQGSRGVFADMRLTTLPWDFSLGSISAPAVVLQGDADVNVTVNMAVWLGRQIPGADVRLFPNEAHFSLVANNAACILSTLLQKAA